MVPAGMVIPANLELIGHKLRSMKGETADAIQAKFLTALSAAVGNLNRISIYLGGSLVAEGKVFSAAREAVAKAVHEAKKACDSVARGGSSKLEIAIKIAKLVADGIAAFTGPLGAAYKATTIGAGVSSVALGGIDASEVKSSGEVKSNVRRYDEALTVLGDVLDKINDDIRNGESALSVNIVDNIGIISSIISASSQATGQLLTCRSNRSDLRKSYSSSFRRTQWRLPKATFRQSQRSYLKPLGAHWGSR